MDRPQNSGTPNVVPSDVVPPNAADQGREYGCKYCAKAFTNKQALGSHQNAHKIQREMEKAVRESRDPLTYNISPDILDRSVVSNFRYNAPQQQQPGMRIGCNARPGRPLAGNAYGMILPVPRCNNFLPRWTASGPRGIIRRFPGHGAHYVQNNGLNFRCPDNGSASSSGMAMGTRLIYPVLSGFAAARARPGGGDNRNGTSEHESGLDLSLKL